MEDTFEYIKGYENLYKINKKGEIWSCSYQKIRNPVIKPGQCYLQITLRKEGVEFKTSIHRLLALQYIDNPDNLPQVDHIDRNRTNNSLDNLRWVTCSENSINRKQRESGNLTEEQLQERKEKRKKYAREWAQIDRLNKGITPKTEMDKTNDPDYKARWAREKRANMSPEDKEAYLVKRREQRKAKKNI
jgi:hypothetical protein